MPLNPADFELVLERAFRPILMDRLEAGVREAANNLCENLKEIVSGPGGGRYHGPVNVTPYVYVDKKTGRTRGRKIEEGRRAPHSRTGPPGMQSGDGMRSIGFEIKERNDEAGTITVMIGVDASAPGGTNQLQSYMVAHDTGILYPTQKNSDIPKHVFQRPWLRSGIAQNYNEFVATVVGISQGIL